MVERWTRWKAARVQALLQILHRLAQDQRVVGGVDAHIIAGRVDLLDRIHIDAKIWPRSLMLIIFS
jgi:isochorismate hydrolase